MFKKWRKSPTAPSSVSVIPRPDPRALLHTGAVEPCGSPRLLPPELRVTVGEGGQEDGGEEAVMERLVASEEEVAVMERLGQSEEEAQEASQCCFARTSSLRQNLRRRRRSSGAAVAARALAGALVEEVLEQVVGAAREEQDPLHLRLNLTLEFDPGGAAKSTPCKAEERTEETAEAPDPNLTITSPPPSSLLSRLARRTWTSSSPSRSLTSPSHPSPGPNHPSPGPRNLHNHTLADSSVASDISLEASRGDGKLCEEAGEEEQGRASTSSQELLQLPGQAEAGRLASEDGEVFLTPSAVSTPRQAFFESPRARLAPPAARHSLPAGEALSGSSLPLNRIACG